MSVLQSEIFLRSQSVSKSEVKNGFPESRFSYWIFKRKTQKGQMTWHLVAIIPFKTAVPDSIQL